MSENSAAQMALLGFVSWHSSEEGSGPDVGISIGLGEGRTLWIGEITSARYEDGGPDVMALGSDHGWWLMLYGARDLDTRVLGKFVDGESARAFADLIEPLIVLAARMEP